jgi:hypothetical protein
MMNNELIMPAEIAIKDKKKIVTGNVVRAAFFAASKILQVSTGDAEDYFLVYFRKTFIFGDKLASIPEGSFIDQAFREGIVFNSSHSILSAVIPKQSVAIPSRSKLFQQLQDHFSSQETAYIATSLDSFFEKSVLNKLIEQLYFHHKRNGQFMKAYQVLQILAVFMPQLKSVQEWMSLREFNSAYNFYHSSDLPAILKKDPLYVELYCFKNRSNPDEFHILEEYLKAKESYLELILFWVEKFRETKVVEGIAEYTKMARQFLTNDQWVRILAEEKINPFSVLPEAKAMIEDLMENGKYEEAAVSLLSFMEDLPPSYDPILKELWKNVDAEFVELHLDLFIRTLQRQGNDGKNKESEDQIYQLIVTMLKDYDLKTVYEKLLPLQIVLPHSLLFRKLSKMVKLLEDPDRMMELGDYYAEFKQYDPAIDCYSWEMELKPKDPDPVWRICKMYQQKGMQIEAAAYQKVFTQLKDIQESI